MQPMPQPASSHAGPAHDHPVGSQAVLPTTYGVAVASQVMTPRHGGQAQQQRDNPTGADASPHAATAQPDWQSEIQSTSSPPAQPSVEDGSQPLASPSAAAGFSFWRRAPINIWAHPTMQRYRQDPTATLAEPPVIVPAGSTAKQDPQEEPRTGSRGSPQQEASPQQPNAAPAQLVSRPSSGSPHAARSRHSTQSSQQPSLEAPPGSSSDSHSQAVALAQRCSSGYRSTPEGRPERPQPAGAATADAAVGGSPSRTQHDHAEPSAQEEGEARQAAADVMGEDEDGGGQRGDPEPLYPAGKLFTSTMFLGSLTEQQ